MLSSGPCKKHKVEKFTVFFVQNLKAPKGREFVEWWAPNGLTLRVHSTGRKSWHFWYRFEGRRRRLFLGLHPEISVAKANLRHARAIDQLSRGIDPFLIAQDEKRERIEADTVAELAGKYLELHSRPNKRSWKADERLLRVEVLPSWGRRKARDITRRDVILLLDAIKARGSPFTANRTLAVVRAMFNWGLSRDMIPATPCSNVRRPAPEKARDRVLGETELRRAWGALSAAADKDLVSLALQVTLATAQRPGEVLGARWSEIDLESKWWLLPGDRTKNGLDHRVPLSSLVLRLLAIARFKGNGSDLVFFSPRKPAKGAPPRPITRQAAARRMVALCTALKIPPATPHDLRRTAASHMTAAGVPRLIVSKVLNHTESSVTAIYDRYSYDADKRAALEGWARTLEAIAEERRA